MRGSRIAKEIEKELKREQARRELLLKELRKRKESAVKIMMKIKALTNYKDKILNRSIVAGEEYEVSNERAKVIVKKGFAIIVEEIKEMAVPKEKAKRNAKK